MGRALVGNSARPGAESAAAGGLERRCCWEPGKSGAVEEVEDEARGVSARSFRAAFPAWDRRLSQQQRGPQAPSLNGRGGEGTSGAGRAKTPVTEDVCCCW